MVATSRRYDPYKDPLSVAGDERHLYIPYPQSVTQLKAHFQDATITPLTKGSAPVTPTENLLVLRQQFGSGMFNERRVTLNLDPSICNEVGERTLSDRFKNAGISGAIALWPTAFSLPFAALHPLVPITTFAVTSGAAYKLLDADLQKLQEADCADAIENNRRINEFKGRQSPSKNFVIGIER